MAVMNNGFGAITWWGLTPAVDFNEIVINRRLGQKIQFHSDDGDTAATKSGDETVNILLVGSSDPRHILQTIARSYRWPRHKINFYVVENNLELLARHLLLMSVSMESPDQYGLQEKSELYLELFGNTLIRKQTCKYLQLKSAELIKMVTDLDYLVENFPLINMTHLKFKERDFLEGIFKFWRSPNDKIFDIGKLWDHRLRQYLGVRYDARSNVYDWDCSMKLHNKQADMISTYEYKHWRETGIAFEPREGNYDVSNRTMFSGMMMKTAEGEKVPRRGYFGDIVTSPFICFGIECENEGMFKKQNKVNVNRAQDISSYNVIALFHELTHKTKYNAPEADESGPRTQGVTLTEITEEEEPAVTGDGERSQTTDPLPEIRKLSYEDFQIFFLPLNILSDIHKKSKFSMLFDTVFFANSMVHTFTPDVTSTFKNGANIIVETSKYILDLKKESHHQYLNTINNMAELSHCKPLNKLEVDECNFVCFSFERAT